MNVSEIGTNDINHSLLTRIRHFTTKQESLNGHMLFHDND